VVLAGCGQWQRVGAPERSQPGVTVTRLFDAGSVYRSMGFFAAGEPLPFVGALRWVASTTPDSTIGVFALSFANHSLGFRRDANEFVANYRVEITFRRDSAPSLPPRIITSDETVRVRGFQETLRADESVIFQQYVTLAPGPYLVNIMVRDRNGTAVQHQEHVDTVPRFAGQGFSTPIPIYEGRGRSRADTTLDLVVNPRATLPYGGDTLGFYIEAYGFPPDTRLAASVVGGNGQTLWVDTTSAVTGTGLSRAIFRIPPDRLPVGQERFHVGAVGGSGEVLAPFLVSFSSQWVITNYEEMVSLLRYFPRQDLVRKLRAAPDSLRPQAWRDFWTASDPVPLTPENESLNLYFHRIQVANQRYQESADPGWLSDRGEVYITIGEPDEAYDLTSDYSRSGVHALRWVYANLRLDLYFVDRTGFGRFQLSPSSRADFERAASRVRQSN
jgi:GWxTD domain-containing protein